MKTVSATRLKNRLGEVLASASLAPVAIVRHGRIVAHLVPPSTAQRRQPASRGRTPQRWGRREEERVLRLCAKGDFRPSRWERAGDRETLAGVATVLASLDGFNRPRMLALAERLWPGMSAPRAFGRWLAATPIAAARFVPLLEAQMKERTRIKGGVKPRP